MLEELLDEDELLEELLDEDEFDEEDEEPSVVEELLLVTLSNEELSSWLCEENSDEYVLDCALFGTASKSSIEHALHIHVALIATNPKINAFFISLFLITNGNDAHIHALFF